MDATRREREREREDVGVKVKIRLYIFVYTQAVNVFHFTAMVCQPFELFA